MPAKREAATPAPARIVTVPQTPPRKRPKQAEADSVGMGSDEKTSANQSSSCQESAGPQVVFSPGKRVHADGHKHDAGAEVRAFLRHQGYSDQEIRTIMAKEAGSRRQSQTGSGPGQRQQQAKQPQPQRLADLASAAKKEADDFAADLMDVLGMDDDVLAGGSTADTQIPDFVLPPAPASASASASAPAEEAQRTQVPASTQSPLLSQLPVGFQEELCATADRIDAEVASQRSQQASQPSPSAFSQRPAKRAADRWASADEIDHLVDDEASQAADRPPQLPPTSQAPGMGVGMGMRASSMAAMATPSFAAQGSGPCSQQPQQTWPAPQRPQHWQQRPPALPQVQLQQAAPQLQWQRQGQGCPPRFGQQTLPVQPVARPVGPPQQTPGMWHGMGSGMGMGVGAGVGLGAGGTGMAAPRPLVASQSSLLDDFDDDDEALLATIRQVEDSVKKEQDHEKLLKEREDELNLELMLVDVDPSAC